MRKGIILLISLIPGLFSVTGCDGNKARLKNEIHLSEVQKEGMGMIYVDKIPCSTVLQHVDSTGSNTGFHCFRVGFIDSLAVAKAPDKNTLEAGKYYQFDVQQDWAALVNGNAVLPVFYQPRQRMENHRYEGVLVFEIPKDKVPDTLIYTDSFGAWGRQQFIINSHEN